MERRTFTWHTDGNELSDLEGGLSLANKSGAKSLLILTCQHNFYAEEKLNTLIRGCSQNVFGGIYPMITFRDTLLKQGALIIGFEDVLNVTLFSDMRSFTCEELLESRITASLNDFHGSDNFLMFYDGLINNVENFINCLFECLDHNITVAGGGAGNIDFIQRPCLFTNQGLHSDAIVIVNLPKALHTSIAHGWKIFQGPFLVSEAENQTVYSLNYQPAFELYQEIIEQESDYRFEDHDFFDIAKNFPLGISCINNDLVVRDPILTENNALQCVGNIPINSMVYLLKGDNKTLISSAEAAAKTVFSPPNLELSTTAVFDCISRVLYMKEDFDKELEIIAQYCTTPTLFGAVCIGEISNSQSGAIRLLNKSTVISTW